jgi:dihydrofolate reductase
MADGRRRLRYNLAPTLDGFLAGADGTYDWIIMDPSIDFVSLFAEFDTFVMGRRTFEVTARTEFMAMIQHKEVIVFSRTLNAADYPGVTVVGSDPAATVRTLKAQPGKDIWLFGGGELFRTLVDANLVDTVELAVMPVLLAQGLPVLPPGRSVQLELRSAGALPSGIVMLSYSVRGAEPAVQAAPPS